MKSREEKIERDPGARENIALQYLGLPILGADRLLDYGCGWGYISRKASLAGWNVLGVDISHNEIGVAKLYMNYLGISNNSKFSTENISNFPEKSFDAVISMMTIEHVHNPGLFLARINLCLKDNGKLIIGIPNIMTLSMIFNHLYINYKKDLLDASQNIVKNYDKTHHHIQAWDALHFVQLVSSVGFQLEEYKPAGYFPMPPKLSWFAKPFFSESATKNQKITPPEIHNTV